MAARNILVMWVDDEIEFLRPHQLFLAERGYEVIPMTNGADAILYLQSHVVDVVLLDEQMPGMHGLEVVARMSELRPGLPIVMVTKSEEEDLMEQALGQHIADYLTKPVNPSQVLLTLKRLLDQGRIVRQAANEAYLSSFGRITAQLHEGLSFSEWSALYTELMRHEMQTDAEEEVASMVQEQLREANRVFSRSVEKQMPQWVAASEEGQRAGVDVDRPLLSHEVFRSKVVPRLRAGEKVVFLVIDCLRYDQWLAMEGLLYDAYSVHREMYCSLLPTATSYARNAIFSGQLPKALARSRPDVWAEVESAETGRNRHEERLLGDQLKQLGLDSIAWRYEKLVGTADGRAFAQQVHQCNRYDLNAVVVNFVDILAHSRADVELLREMTPDEKSYRALTRTWFEHSWLRAALEELSQAGLTVVVTTDHGAIRVQRDAKVIGDRNTTTALRYKIGKNLKVDPRQALVVDDLSGFGLPSLGLGTNLIVAREDYYFVYPTQYNRYANVYRDSMQHGGISLEEMLLPLITLSPKKGGTR